MTKVLTALGCSFTAGTGFAESVTDPRIYVNQLDRPVRNLAVCGNTNLNIFQSALHEILFNDTDVIVQWTTLNRHWLYPDLDLCFPIAGVKVAGELKYLDTYFDKSTLQQFSDMFRLLNGDYHNMLAVLEYSRVLETVARGRCDIIFVNGVLPWTSDLADPAAVSDPSANFSEYSKQLLKTEQLPDVDVQRFFAPICQGFADLDHSLWFNMFNSLENQAIDRASDGHPGPASHAQWAQALKK